LQTGSLFNYSHVVNLTLGSNLILGSIFQNWMRRKFKTKESEIYISGFSGPRFHHRSEWPSGEGHSSRFIIYLFIISI